MNHTVSDNFSRRVEELCADSVRHACPRFLGFLTPEEQTAARTVAAAIGDVFVLPFGLTADAERVVLGFFPSDIYVTPEDGGDLKEYRSWAQIAALEIRGSGYRVFTHRDVLGSILSLGVKRETVGDILLTDDGHTAYAAVSASVADYLVTSLTRVANDKVHVSVIDENRLPAISRRYADMVLTLASVRLDALVAEIAKCSRDKAKGLLAAGKVSLNHAVVTACDKGFSEGDTVSVSGVGKFLVDGFLGLTAKERTRVVVRKYL